MLQHHAAAATGSPQPAAQQLSSAAYVQYASPLPPGSQLGTGYPTASASSSAVAWGVAPTRYVSVDGSASAVQATGYGGGLRMYSAELTPGHSISPVTHYGPGQQYQQPTAQYGIVGGTPISYHQAASPVPQNPFSFLPGVHNSQLCSNQPFQFEVGSVATNAVQAPAASPGATPPVSGQALLAPAPSGLSTPQAQPVSSSPSPAASSAPTPGSAVAAATTAAPAAAATAAATVVASADPRQRSPMCDALCEKVFSFVDACQTGHLDSLQNKTGLTMVFVQLGDVPVPKDQWYGSVFKNFNREGLVDYKNFRDIVRQWDEHHLKKRVASVVAAGASGIGASCGLPPPPPAGEMSELVAPGAGPRVLGTGANAGVSASSGGSESFASEGSSSSEEGEDSPAASGLDDRGQPAVRSAGGVAQSPQAREEALVTPSASPSTANGGDSVRRGQSRQSASRSGAAALTSEVMFPTYEGKLAIFEDYEFFGDVGAGSFGKVMVVRHRHTKQLRACKVVSVQSALQRELIDTEIKLLKSLNHPNIMKMHEVYFEQPLVQGRVSNGNIYLITELCEGGDLFSRILHHYERLKQPMKECHVAFMMKQILAATKYCHEQNIIHRDIKPENILFVDRSSSSALKIIDFGLANFTQKIMDEAREVKVPRAGAMAKFAKMLPTVGGKHLIPWHDRKKVMQKAGTPHYMAPEMIEGYYDEKADLFSIGIILCQLLTGWHPFYVPGDDEQSVKAKITAPVPVDFPMDIWSQVTPAALDLCKKLVDKSAKTRPGAAQALAHPWFQDPAKPSPYGNVEGLSVSIFEGLMQYQAYNKLKRAVLQLLTRELSEFQIQELRNKFMALDREGNGLLTPSELLEGMRHVGYEMSPEEVQRVVSALDPHCQKIGYKEFIAALIQRKVNFDRQQLLECFKKFDTNNSGKISYEDVKSKLSCGISQSEWEEIAGQGAGKMEITFPEFCVLMEQSDD